MARLRTSLVKLAWAALPVVVAISELGRRW
jgi:hypothetical protein